MAKKYSEILKEKCKGYANDAAAFSCDMEYYMDCGKYDIAKFYKSRVDMCLKYARQFKEWHLKWKKIEEGA